MCVDCAQLITRMHQMKHDRYGRSALHYAALNNDAAEVKRLIAEGSELDLGEKLGFTPLHLAAQDFGVEAAEILLKHGAVVDAINRFGNTPLFVAVFNSRGRGEMIQLLRRHGADPDKANNHGQTPVRLARLIGNYDVAQFFNDLS